MMYLKKLFRYCIKGLLFFSFLISCFLAKGQNSTILTDALYSTAISGNLTGENPVRKMAIYLPSGYNMSKKRYPVLYLLHGVGDDYTTFTGDTLQDHNIKDVMDRGIAEGKFGEMIVVMPDEKTSWFGSFYTDSKVSGNWEQFTVKELVAFIDNKYRTVAAAWGRAIAGHSMGGYGAISLAMKHPDIFSAVYGMNAALICFRGEIRSENAGVQIFARARTQEQLKRSANFVAMGLLAVARAFSANPAAAPLYVDKPFKWVRGKVQISQPAYRKWLERDVVHMARLYRENLLRLKGIKFDSGRLDDSAFILENNRLFHKKLTSLGINHEFEEYQGDHNNKLWGLNGRILNQMLPYIYLHMVK